MTMDLNETLEEHCRKEGVVLTPEQLEAVEVAIAEYTDSQDNALVPKPTHRKRRASDYLRLKKALTNLSSDTRKILCAIASEQGFNLSAVIDGLPEMERRFLFVENARTGHKEPDYSMRLLILKLADIYKEAFGKRAAYTREGPFQLFLEAAGVNVNDKTIQAALYHLRHAWMRIWDERPPSRPAQ
jgi:hypothetical protein